MNLKNAKQLIFNSKEQYLNFRKAWAAAANSPKAKSKLVPCDVYRYHWENGKGKYQLFENEGTRLEKGWITSTHTLLFCLVTERDITKAFTPFTNKNKLVGGQRPFSSLEQSLHSLWWITENARLYIDAKRGMETNAIVPYSGGMRDVKQWEATADRAYKNVEKFVKPFEDAITFEMLSKLYDHLTKLRTKPNGQFSSEETRKKIKELALTISITRDDLWNVYQLWNSYTKV